MCYIAASRLDANRGILVSQKRNPKHVLSAISWRPIYMALSSAVVNWKWWNLLEFALSALAVAEEYMKWGDGSLLGGMPSLKLVVCSKPGLSSVFLLRKANDPVLRKVKMVFWEERVLSEVSVIENVVFFSISHTFTLMFPYKFYHTILRWLN